MLEHVNISKLAGAARARRGTNTLREASKQAGVSHMTLQRIEKEEPVDFNSFVKVCAWLDLPWDYFRLEFDETA